MQIDTLDDRMEDGGFDHGAHAIAPEVELLLAAPDAYVVATVFNRAGDTLFAPAGDGKIYRAQVADASFACLATGYDDAGQVVCAVPDVDTAQILVGCDSGRLLAIDPDGAAMELSRTDDGRWIDTVATHPKSSLRAYASGKTITVITSDGTIANSFSGLISTPSGLAFSPDGMRLAAALYNGVTIWDLASGAQVCDLFWRGSHTAIAWSGNGSHIATATQDRELHCWRLADKRDYRMSGYSAKIRALQWTADSAFICASGADTLTSWYCGDGGPAGKPPLEFGHVFNGTVTQLITHPTLCQAAAGYSDGSVLIGDIRKGDAIIAKRPEGGAISAIAWAPDGCSLAAGTEHGQLALMRIASGRIEV